MNLFTLLELIASGSSDRVLIGPSGDGMSGAEIMALALGGARFVAETNAQTVVYIGENGPAFPLAMFAAAGAAVPFMPLNYRWPDEQLAEAVAEAKDPLLICDAGVFGQSPGAHFLSTDAWLDQCRGVQAAELPRTSTPDDIALLLMTSGTTAKPKHAVLRHRHLTSYVIESVEFCGSATDEAVLVSVPPYHIAAVANVISNLYSGRRIVYLENFSAAAWLEVAAGEGITHAMVVPTMLTRIVDELDARPDRAPRALRSLSYGGARVAPPVLERALRILPHVDFVNAYGLTETSSTIAVLTPEDHRVAMASVDAAVRARLGSVGRPLPAIEIEIRSAEGIACGRNVVGTVHVRGPQVAGEYLETGSLTTHGGWFATRDEGFLDADGYLFVRGRADDTIIRGGENIAPAEIEAVLLDIPEIADAAVVGVPDDEWGQRIAAFVVRRAGEEIDEAAVQHGVRSVLRSARTPDHVHFVEALPYGPTGKLIRRELLEYVAGGGSH